MREVSDAERALAERLVDEALEGYTRLIPAVGVAAVRRALLDQLLFTEAGQAQLARLAPREGLEKSGEVAREPVPALTKKKAGSGT